MRTVWLTRRERAAILEALKWSVKAKHEYAGYPSYEAACEHRDDADAVLADVRAKFRRTS